jgi:hypothetical protein
MNSKEWKQNRQWLNDVLEQEDFEDELLLWMLKNPKTVGLVAEEILNARDIKEIEDRYTDDPLGYNTELGQEVEMKDDPNDPFDRYQDQLHEAREVEQELRENGAYDA